MSFICQRQIADNTAPGRGATIKNATMEVKDIKKKKKEEAAVIGEDPQAILFAKHTNVRRVH